MRTLILTCLIIFSSITKADTLSPITAWFDKASEKDLSAIAESINTSVDTHVLEHQVVSASYDLTSRLFSQKLENPHLTFSDMTLGEARVFGQKKRQSLTPLCHSNLRNLIYNERVTFRFFFKDKEGIMTSLVDISALTCEAMSK